MDRISLSVLPNDAKYGTLNVFRTSKHALNNITHTVYAKIPKSVRVRVKKTVGELPTTQKNGGDKIYNKSYISVC